MCPIQDFLIIVVIGSILYPMRNIFGFLTRFCIYGLMAYTLFSDYADDLVQKVTFLAILSIPILISFIFRYFKLKFFKI